jgi:hypothetical protein
MSVAVSFKTSEIEIIKYDSAYIDYIEEYQLSFAIKAAILAYDAACPNKDSLQKRVLKLLGET